MTTETILIRLAMAILFSGVIGYDRQRKNRPAGLRTHILVCIGATSLAMVQDAIFIDKLTLHPEIHADHTRLLAPIVSGIGFLGAGTIVVTKQRVAGLTTAASLWTTAGLGIAIGMGYYRLAGLTFLAIFFSLTAIRWVVHVPNVKRIEIHYIHRVATKEFLQDFFAQHQVERTDIIFDVQNVNDHRLYRTIFTAHLPKELSHVDLIEELATHPDIKKIRLVPVTE